MIKGNESIRIQAIRIIIRYHVFDLWWIYKNPPDKSCPGFLITKTYLLLTVYLAVKLLRLSE
jgi:hypothetical protein